MKLKLAYNYASIGCNWKGIFAGEDVQHDPDQQLGSAAKPAPYCLVLDGVDISHHKKLEVDLSAKLSPQLQCGFILVQVVSPSFCQGLGLQPFQ